MSIADDYEMPDTDTSAADKRLVVRFSMQPRLDSNKTAEEGREIFRECEFVTILIPGDKTLNVHRPVQASDKQRFPLQYQAFKNKTSEVIIGTPLSAWPLVNDSQRRELEYFNIRTVEQLANVADSFAGNMLGVHALKQQATKYLESSKDNAQNVKLQKALEEQENKNKALEAQIADLARLVEKATTLQGKMKG